MVSTILCLISYIIASISVGCFGLVLHFMAYLHYIHKINDLIPGPPRSSFMLGNLPEVWKYKAETGNTFGHYLLEKRFEYRPIFVIFFFHKAIVYLGDPSYMRNVFINNHKSVHEKDCFFYHKLGFIFGERGAGYGVLMNPNEESWRKRRQTMNH